MLGAEVSRNTSINWPHVVCLAVKPVGEPDAGDRHVRFDERGWETGRCRMAQATAPILDSTDSDLPGQSANWPVSGEERKSTNPRRTISIYEYMPERPRWSSSFFCRTSRANLINKISLARRAQSVSHHGQLGPRRPAPGMVVNPHKLPIAMGEPLLLVMRVQRPKVGLEVLKTADERRGEHHRHARASSLVCRAGPPPFPRGAEQRSTGEHERPHPPNGRADQDVRRDVYAGPGA